MLPERRHDARTRTRLPASRALELAAGARPRLRLAMSMAGMLLAAVALTLPMTARAQELLNVSYDPTRELYRDYNAAFAKHWQDLGNSAPSIETSHGGSGAQARAVIDGLNAQVVTLALASDIDRIADAGKLPEDWQSKLPHNSSPYTSTIVFLVRQGNPKGIKDWDDLVKPGISVIIPNPKTSGNGRYSYLGAWAYAAKKFDGDEAKVRDFIRALFKNVPVLETGGRAATNTFVQKDIGDVLLTFESEILQISRVFSPDKYDIVIPSLSIAADAPVAVVAKYAEKHKTTEIAKGYLEYLWSDEGQKLAVKYYFRPRSAALLAENAALFPKVDLISIDEGFGGWEAAQKTHFADGGFFDQIYGPTK